MANTNYRPEGHIVVNLVLSKKLKEWLKIFAANNQTNMSVIVNRLIQDFKNKNNDKNIEVGE